MSLQITLTRHGSVQPRLLAQIQTAPVTGFSTAAESDLHRAHSWRQDAQEDEVEDDLDIVEDDDDDDEVVDSDDDDIVNEEHDEEAAEHDLTLLAARSYGKKTPQQREEWRRRLKVKGQMFSMPLARDLPERC